MDISIHAPLRERHNGSETIIREGISIHAPLRERRKNPLPADCWSAISIHAPSRERRDSHAGDGGGGNVSIHAPSRERLMMAVRSVINERFNPRSLTGATGHKKRGPQDMAFQSTLPYGSDFTCSHFSSDAVLFQSTLPYGSDFLIASPALPMPDFNPHSLTGATFSSNASSTSSAFQSTLPYGSDQCQQGNTA